MRQARRFRANEAPLPVQPINRVLEMRPGLHLDALIPLLHYEPTPLFVAEIKLRHSSGLSRLLIRRVNGPEILGALPNERSAPASQRRGFLSRGTQHGPHR